MTDQTNGQVTPLFPTSPLVQPTQTPRTKRKGKKEAGDGVTGSDGAVIALGKPPEPASTPSQLAAQVVESVKKDADNQPRLEMEDDDFPATVDPVLVRILSWKRPFESTGEINFMTWLHKEIEHRGHKLTVAAKGNVIVTVPRKDGKVSSVMFSCHTDTVHSDCNGDQRVFYDPQMGHIFLDTKDPSAGSCLGADDGAGIWLMLEMMSAQVPGTYVFHRGEERHGVGSHALLAEGKQFLESFDIAVAFDRKDVGDVIVTQGGQPCASLKCGEALAKRLNELGQGFKYSICHGGSFTDTRVYRGVIDECLNLSVGYENAHSSQEYLDYAHLVKLREAVIKLDWDALPVDRDAKKAVEPTRTYTPQYGGRSYGQYGLYAGAGMGDDDDDDAFPHKSAGKGTLPPGTSIGKPAATGRGKKVGYAPSMDLEPALLDELRTMDFDEIRDLVQGDPDAALDVLVSLFAELEAAYAKMNTLRGLLGLATKD
jgi:hypothetical protein